jgi:hypothetical protein
MVCTDMPVCLESSFINIVQIYCEKINTNHRA